MPQSFASLHIHLIFSTKHREPLLTPDILPRVLSYLGGIARADGHMLVAAGGMPDHVHLLLSMNRQSSIADAVRSIKSESSKWVHETFPNLRSFAWQAGYGAFAVSYSSIGRVRDYLARQIEHHRAMAFQEEFRNFLQRHQIPFEERFLWD